MRCAIPEKNLRSQFSEAHAVVEIGASKVSKSHAVGHHEPWESMTPEQRELRRRLRACGRRLGDHRDPCCGEQAQTLLMPVSVRRQLNDLPDEIRTRINIEFDMERPDGVFKALTG